MRIGLFLVAVSLLSPAVAVSAALEKLVPDTPRVRRPIALRCLDSATVLVANDRSGSMSLVDLPTLSVAAEFAIGGRPSDLELWDGGVLVTDAERSRLIALHVSRESAEVVWELPLPTSPVSVRVSPDGRWCSVCSLWARRVVFVELPISDAGAGRDPNSPPSSSPRIVASVDLPFAPREQILVADSARLVVADAFSGRLAVIGLESYKLEAVHEFPSHNIRGLALNPQRDRLLVSHQILNEVAPPRPTEIIWGVLLSNGIRELRLEHVSNPQADVMTDSRFIPLGDGSQGAGDPDALVVDARGRAVIALAGIGEVAIVEPDGFSLQRVPVGRRPAAIIHVGDERFLVANELSDSLSLVDLAAKPEHVARSGSTPEPSAETNSADATYVVDGTYSVNRAGLKDEDVAVRHINLGPAPQSTAADRGEALFFSARLSRGNWFSCHSCHTDGHSNGGLSDTFGDGFEGAPKRILSLLGVSETGPWAWRGDKAALKDQIHQSVRSTMQGPDLSDSEAADLVAFLTTLRPPPPFQPAVSPADAALVTRGRELFESLNCHACHAGDTLTSDAVYDVGLTDVLGTKDFNPPSLRGVGHRDGLFHDKRAANLDDVITHFRHQLPRPLDSDQQRALIRYLNSL